MNESQNEHLEAIESATEDTAEALSRIENTLKKIESAVSNIRSYYWPILIFLCAFGAWDVAKDIWHSKWRYGLWYSIDTSKINVHPRPHDCNFMAAPLGAKYCEYERKVYTVQWSKSQIGKAIASYDDGKTWTEFIPAPTDVVPDSPQVVLVNITWEKVTDGESKD